jgi:hypothetical protein
MVSMTDPIPLRAIAHQRLREELAFVDGDRGGIIDNAEAEEMFRRRGVDPATLGEPAISRLRRMSGVPWVDVSSMPNIPLRVRTSTDLETARWFYAPNAPQHKGDFRSPGFGAGHLRVGRGVHEDISEYYRKDGSYVSWQDPDYQQYAQKAVHQTLDIVAVCDLVDMKKMRNIDENGTRIALAPKGFVRDHQKYAPLTTYLVDAHGPDHRHPGNPEIKQLQASIDVEELRTLLGKAEQLELYIEVRMKDGAWIPLNLDGVTGKNFVITADDLK